MIPLMKTAFFHEYETKEALAEFIRTTDRLSMSEQCFLFEKAETFTILISTSGCVCVPFGKNLIFFANTLASLRIILIDEQRLTRSEYEL